MSQAFGRDRRLARKADFRRVYEHGRVYRAAGFVCHVLEAVRPEAPSRLGITVSRKVGRAHERNRYKRWAREVFRREPLRDGFDIVITFHRQIASVEFAQFQSALVRVFEKAHLCE